MGTALDVAIASCTATLAASLAGVPPIKSVLSAGSAPLPSAAARAAQPVSETWVLLSASHLSFVSAPVGGGGAPAGGGGARRAKRSGPRRRGARAVSETKSLQRGPQPQGRREGHQPRVADGEASNSQSIFQAAAGRLTLSP